MEELFADQDSVCINEARQELKLRGEPVCQLVVFNELRHLVQIDCSVLVLITQNDLVVEVEPIGEREHRVSNVTQQESDQETRLHSGMLSTASIQIGINGENHKRDKRSTKGCGDEGWLEYWNGIAERGHRGIVNAKELGEARVLLSDGRDVGRAEKRLNE